MKPIPIKPSNDVTYLREKLLDVIEECRREFEVQHKMNEMLLSRIAAANNHIEQLSLLAKEAKNGR